MPHENIRALKCFAGGQPFCLDIGDVVSIRRGENLVPNPAPNGPRGWIELGPARLPVFGLAELLQLNPASAELGPVLVLDRARPWGLAVDRVTRIEIGDATLQPLPAPARVSGTSCFRGVIPEGDSLTLWLAPEFLRADAAQPLASGVAAPAPAPVPATAAKPSRARAQILLFSPPNPMADGAPGGPSSRLSIGLSYSQTIEIVSGVQRTPAPGAPPHVLGLVPWRSRPVTVVDAGFLLGLAPAVGAGDGRVAIVRSPRWQSVVAFPVGGGIHTRTLPLPYAPCPPGITLDRSHMRGAFSLDDQRLLVLPDVDAMAAPPTDAGREPRAVPPDGRG